MQNINASGDCFGYRDKKKKKYERHDKFDKEQGTMMLDQSSRY